MDNEFDPSGLSLNQALANILKGLSDPEAWKKTGQSISDTAKVIPNVAESLARGGVAQAIGTTGDLRDFRNTVQSYLPKSVQNFSNTAEFLTNPYAKALIQTAPTTESTKEFVPRATDPYQGYEQHETLGEYIAPSLGYLGAKALRATKDLPIGLSIDDVTPKAEPAKLAEVLRQPEKDAYGFYSPLEEAVLNLKNEKGTGEQYLAQLTKTPGVKQEEMTLRGLDQFLSENPKVTKEQISQHLRDNPVRLEETILDANSTRELDSMPYEEYRLGSGEVIDDTDYIDDIANDEYFNIKNDPELLEEYRLKAYEETGIDPLDMDLSESNEIDDYVDNLIREKAEQYANDAYYDYPYLKYEDELGYTVTGNDDVGYYIKDPNGREVPVSSNGVYNIDQVEDYIRDDAVQRGFLHYEDDAGGTKYHDYTLPNGSDNYKEVLMQYPNVKGQDYHSGHFDEPNILAHFRTNDRTIDGKKTLFIEEIQSDWHQQGRKRGYATADSDKKLDEITKKQGDLVKKMRTLREERSTQVDDPEVYDKLTIQMDEINAEQMALQQELNNIGSTPDAPFKKNWQELAMKRAIQMATEGGYDRVAFTTGKQQAERYNLSKQVDQINWMPYESNGSTKVVRIQPKNGNTIELRLSPEGKVMNGGNGQFADKSIDEVIGKDIAKKIMDENNGDLSGVNLDIGGEGMKGFYDKMLPDFVNKYGKKHGLKVGRTSLKDGPVYRDFNNWVANKDPSMSNTFIKHSWDNMDELYLEYLKEGMAKDQEAVHYFDLTPQAKESFLSKGQPMFAGVPLIGLGGMDEDEAYLDNLLIKLKAQRDALTKK